MTKPKPKKPKPKKPKPKKPKPKTFFLNESHELPPPLTTPVCSDCLLSGHAGGEPDFPWHRAAKGEACGVVDHAGAGEPPPAPPAPPEAWGAVLVKDTAWKARWSLWTGNIRAVFTLWGLRKPAAAGKTGRIGFWSANLAPWTTPREYYRVGWPGLPLWAVAAAAVGGSAMAALLLGRKAKP